jgi:hypothetical protein
VVTAAFALGIRAAMKAVVEIDYAFSTCKLASEARSVATRTVVPDLHEIAVKLVGTDDMRIVQMASGTPVVDAALVRKIV